MRKTTATLLVLLLAGCGTTGASDSTSEPTTVTSSASATTPSEPSPEPTPQETTEPSDLSTQAEGDNIIYRFAKDKFSLAVPATWKSVVDSSRAFPVALANEDGSQRIVVGEIGSADLMPAADVYATLLAEKLGLDAGQVAYLGQQYLGREPAPAYQVIGDGYVANLYLVTVNGTLYEVSVRGSDTAALQRALDIAASVEIS